jgi:hypothetical protein
VKTIIENSTNLSKYLFDDDKAVVLEEGRIVVGDSSNPDFYIGDMNSGTATLHSNVTNSPSDWTGGKYLFDGTTWTQNPNWIDPDKHPE